MKNLAESEDDDDDDDGCEMIRFSVLFCHFKQRQEYFMMLFEAWDEEKWS